MHRENYIVVTDSVPLDRLRRELADEEHRAGYVEGAGIVVLVSFGCLGVACGRPPGIYRHDEDRLLPEYHVPPSVQRVVDNALHDAALPEED